MTSNDVTTGKGKTGTKPERLPLVKPIVFNEPPTDGPDEWMFAQNDDGTGELYRAEERTGKPPIGGEPAYTVTHRADRYIVHAEDGGADDAGFESFDDAWSHLTGLVKGPIRIAVKIRETFAEDEYRLVSYRRLDGGKWAWRDYGKFIVYTSMSTSDTISVGGEAGNGSTHITSNPPRYSFLLLDGFMVQYRKPDDSVYREEWYR